MTSAPVPPSSLLLELLPWLPERMGSSLLDEINSQVVFDHGFLTVIEKGYIG